MRVLRGRAETLEADRQRTETMVEETIDRGEPAVRIRRPHPQVAFGPRDATNDNYDNARALARRAGFPVIERNVGGRAVAFTGSTLAITLAEPDGDRGKVEDRYDRITAWMRDGLAAHGVDVREGEPDGAFCPGTHSLQSEGKIAGFAQRVRRDVAIVSGVLVVRDHERIGTVLGPIYEALDIPFDPNSVGSVARAGGDPDPELLVDRLLESDRLADATATSVRET